MLVIPVLLLALSGPAVCQVSEMSLDPLLSFFSCVRESRPGFCLRERALGYFETWLTGDEEAEENAADPGNEEEDEPGSRLSPYWKSMVDQVANRIAGIYGEEEEEEEEDSKGKELTGDTRLAQPADTKARHKKYKKDKKVKVAMTIILLIIYFIISQLFYMFDKVARTLIFAKLVLAFKIFVMTKLIQLKRYIWWVKEEKKEVHHEVSLHDHHWDEPQHFDHYPPPEPHYPGPHDHYDQGWGWHRSADPYRGYSSTPPAPGR